MLTNPVFIKFKGKKMRISSVFKRFLRITVFMILSIGGAGNVYAATFKGVGGFGIDVGGDTIVTAVYSDGKTANLKAHQGFVFYGGGVMVTGDFETQATIGYKFSRLNGSNGSITFNAIPVELMEFYRTTNVRMGLGVSYQSNANLNIDVLGSSKNGTRKYGNPLGTVLQIGWAPVSGPLSIDLRYTLIKYIDSTSSEEYNGNTAGIYMSFFF